MISIKTKKVEKLSKKEIEFMNKARFKEYGKNSSVNFKKEDVKAEFIFVLDNRKIMAFGMMKPVNIELKKTKYKIFGIGRGIALRKGKGYGRILNEARIKRLKKLKKTGIAFTSKNNIGFFEKVGYKIIKDGIRKFVYKNPKTEDLIEDNDGQLVYFEGKDKFVTKLFESKNKAIMDADFW